MVFVLNFLNSKVQTRPFILEFSGFYILFNLQLSRFFVVVCLSSNSFSISDVVLFVNNFFYLFFWTFWKFVPRSHGASIIIANVELNVNNFSKLSTKSDNFIISSQNRHSIILLCKPDFFPTFLWIMWITLCKGLFTNELCKTQANPPPSCRRVKKSGFSWILSSFPHHFPKGLLGCFGRALWILHAPGFLLSQNFGADYVMYYSPQNF